MRGQRVPHPWQPGRRQLLVAVDGLLRGQGPRLRRQRQRVELLHFLTSGQMPRGQAKLSTTLLNLVAAWINAGALNN